MSMGYDLSQHNGDITKLIPQFVILRAGCGLVVDRNFENNYTYCKKIGIPVGVYWYSHARNAVGAVSEYQLMKKLIDGKQFEYPIFYDLEETYHKTKSVMNIALCFLSAGERDGYYMGVYMNENMMKNYTNTEFRNRYVMWVAKWGSNQPSTRWDIWQYTDSNNTLDKNICNIDYPSIMIKHHKNGY